LSPSLKEIPFPAFLKSPKLFIPKKSPDDNGRTFNHFYKKYPSKVMEISEKVAKLNISFNILRGGEQQDKLIRNLAQRVEDFIIECVKFTTTVAKRVPGRVDNLPITQVYPPPSLLTDYDREEG
jgi:hypothetical protein